MDQKEKVVKDTGKLFGELWKPFDDTSFEFSVGLFRKRFESNGFDLGWFEGKRCLDVGCGGGRYCIAMARAGAQEVIGVDVGAAGLQDARRRSVDYPQVSFQEVSALELPFGDNEFDFVFSSGVLHHTPDPEKGFAELARVLKPGGKIYLLLYASGGVRWPAVMDFRQCLKDVSVSTMKEVMHKENFPANKIRTLIDDLKVPLIDFYTWEYVLDQLSQNGIDKVQRWEKGRFDHEENIDEMIKDMEWFKKFFVAGKKQYPGQSSFLRASDISGQYLAGMRLLKESVAAQRISREDAERIVIGQGHHRLLGEKTI